MMQAVGEVLPPEDKETVLDTPEEAIGSERGYFDGEGAEERVRLGREEARELMGVMTRVFRI